MHFSFLNSIVKKKYFLQKIGSEFKQGAQILNNNNIRHFLYSNPVSRHIPKR